MPWFFAFLFLVLAACSSPPSQEGIHGYLEGKYVDLAAEVAGRLEHCADEGTMLAPEDTAFQLNPEPESIELRQREAEVRALKARHDQSGIELRLARTELQRLRSLSREHFISQNTLDRARAAADKAQAILRATQASLAAARENIRRLHWLIKQKRQEAKAASRVERCFFEPGEWVAAGQAVVRLLPAGSIKAVIFVPEARLAGIAPGKTIQLRLDGVPGTIPARVSYIASEPEFTPPVIYSEDVRATLVYRVEATIARKAQQGLHPGQPVDAIIP